MRHDIYTGHKKRKAKKSVRLKKNERNRLYIEIDQYSPETGEKLEPQKRGVVISELIIRRDKVQEVLDDLNELIADIEELG